MPGYPQMIVPVGHIEPVPRRVRAVLGDRIVLDTHPRPLRVGVAAVPAVPRPARRRRRRRPGRRGVDEDRPLGRARRYGLRTGGEERPALGLVLRRGAAGRSPAVRVAGAGRLVRGGRGGLRPPAQPLRPRRRRPLAAARCGSSATGCCSPSRRPPCWCSRPGCRPAATCPAPTSGSSTSSRATPAPGAPTRVGPAVTGRSPAAAADAAWSYDFPAASVLPIAGLVAFLDEAVDVVLDGVAQARPVTHFSP